MVLPRPPRPLLSRTRTWYKVMNVKHTDSDARIAVYCIEDFSGSRRQLGAHTFLPPAPKARQTPTVHATMKSGS